MNRCLSLPSLVLGCLFAGACPTPPMVSPSGPTPQTPPVGPDASVGLDAGLIETFDAGSEDPSEFDAGSGSEMPPPDAGLPTQIIDAGLVYTDAGSMIDTFEWTSAGTLEDVEETILDVAIDSSTLLGQDGFVVFTDEALVYTPWLGVEPKTTSRPQGDLISAALLADESVFIATTEALYLIDDDEIFFSPLTELFVPYDIQQMVHTYSPTSGDNLFFASANELSVWQEGTLYGLDPLELPVEGATLQKGPAMGTGLAPRDAIWVSADDEIYFFAEEDDGELRAWSVGSQVDHEDFAVTENALFLVMDGELLAYHRREGWGWIDLGATLSSISAHGETSRLWLWGESEAWTFDGQRLWNVPAPLPDLQTLGVDGEGQLYIGGVDGLRRKYGTRFARWEGIRPFHTLEQLRSVFLHVAFPETLSHIDLRLDQAPIPLQSDWSIGLQPFDLGGGQHTVFARVFWSDSTQVVETRLEVLVDPDLFPPTWTSDIYPDIFEPHCAVCHGPQGGPRRLDRLGDWQGPCENDSECPDGYRCPTEMTEIEEDSLICIQESDGLPMIDNIIFQLENGLMPLGADPLANPLVEMIKRWKEAGFPP